jgi:hypothetical protein
MNLRLNLEAGKFGSFDTKYCGKPHKIGIIFRMNSIDSRIKVKGSRHKALGLRRKEKNNGKW